MSGHPPEEAGPQAPAVDTDPSREANPVVEAQEAAKEAEGPLAGELLWGTPVSPGLALGVARRKDHDLDAVAEARVARDEVEGELNRFRRSLDASRRQLEDLKARLADQVAPGDARILDTHLAYLKDSVFIADVEELIIGEQMRLEAAIAKVIADFDRIFRLVENEVLRERAVDLRDVGIRVLRNLETREGTDEPAEPAAPRPRDYVLVDYDIERSRLDAAIGVASGFESATVSPLHDPEWAAVRVMVRRAETNAIMDALADVGARAIIVTRIHAARI